MLMFFTLRIKSKQLLKRLKFGQNVLKRTLSVTFRHYKLFLESSCECLSQEVKSKISEHLLSMAKILRKYFHQPDPNNTWIRNPFSCDIEKIKNLSEQEQDELIDLVTNGTMKNIFNDKKLIDFWLIV
uniref:Zinc finger BED domain-containing protein 5 n=1 Tax=Sipha flava TaxID=143950 RepID=A0A2S2QJW1_9HEMI